MLGFTARFVPCVRIVIAAVLVFAAPALRPAHAQYSAERVNQGVVGIVSGGVAGTYVQFANDLAAVLDDDKLRILPILGKGSVQNIIDILYLKGVDMGIVQSDVMTLLRRENRFPGLESRMQYVTKLYNEELHLLARSDIRSVEDLADKPVNVDGRNSGTFITATLVFDALGIAIQPTFHDQALALQKLKDGEIAAMMYVAGKPTALFRNASRDDGMHLLSVPLTPALLESYLPSRLTAEDYPRLIESGSSVETLGVGAVLAVFNWDPESARFAKVARFVDALFTKLDDFQRPPRHPKWREVSLSARAPGWTRFRAAEEWLRRNSMRVAQEVADPRMRQEFDRFLASETRSNPLDTLTRDQREALFQRFIRWQGRPALAGSQ